MKRVLLGTCILAIASVHIVHAADIAFLRTNAGKGWQGADGAAIAAAMDWDDLYSEDTLTVLAWADVTGSAVLDAYDGVIVNYNDDNPGNVEALVAGTTTPIISFAGYSSQAGRLGLTGSPSFKTLSATGSESILQNSSHPMLAGIPGSNGDPVDIFTQGGNGGFATVTQGSTLLTTDLGDPTPYVTAAFLAAGTSLAGGATTQADMLYLNLPSFGSANGLQTQLSADGLTIIDNFRGTYIAPIPEPAAVSMLAVAAAALLFLRRRRASH